MHARDDEYKTEQKKATKIHKLSKCDRVISGQTNISFCTKVLLIILIILIRMGWVVIMPLVAARYLFQIYKKPHLNPKYNLKSSIKCFGLFFFLVVLQSSSIFCSICFHSNILLARTTLHQFYIN